MNFKISFVIPCYNGGKYILNLLSQLVSIESNSFEIIIVNDGSKDDTLSTVSKWAKKYPFINLIDQKNQGASAARNNGVNSAQGEYICFLDCDDAIIAENYTTILEQIDNDDLYLYNVKKNTDGKVYSYIEQTDGYSNKEALISSNQFVNAPWGKIIKRTLINENNLFFNTDLKVSEDLLWSVQLLHACQTIKTMNIDFYIYKTDNVTSTTNSINSTKLEGLWKALTYTVDWCDVNKCSTACYGVCSYHYMMNCAYCYKEYDKYISYYHNYKYLLKYSLNKRVSFVNVLSKIIGLKLTSLFLYKYLMR